MSENKFFEADIKNMTFYPTPDDKLISLDLYVNLIIRPSVTSDWLAAGYPDLDQVITGK